MDDEHYMPEYRNVGLLRAMESAEAKRFRRWSAEDACDNTAEGLAHSIARDILDIEARLDGIESGGDRQRGIRSVIAIGVAVEIGTKDDPIGAVVQAVSLRGDGGSSVQYECVWWEGKTRKSEWIGESEILRMGNRCAPKMEIGFVYQKQEGEGGEG